MSFKTTSIILSADVANAGTVTVAYPAGTAQADFTGANAAADGVAIVNDNDIYNEADSDIALSYGASDITLTNNSGGTWASGSTVRVQLGIAGGDAPGFEPAPAIADAAAAALSTSNTYTDAAVNAEIDVLGAKVTTILQALRSQGIIAE